MNIDGARWLFGSYSGYAATVFNLPVGILASVGVSVVPIITKCVTIEDYRKLNDVLVMQDNDSNRMCRYFFAENIFKHSRKISAINELITTPNMFISGIFISIYDKIIFKIVDSVSLKKGRAIFPEA